MKLPTQYNTGLKRLDTLLNAIAYGTVIIGLFCVAAIASILLWTHWKLFE